MRELDVKLITENVAEMCKEAAYYLPGQKNRPSVKLFSTKLLRTPKSPRRRIVPIAKTRA